MEKILFIRSDRFGEFLCSLPAIKIVKSNYPQSKIYLLARKSNMELSQNLDFIDYLLEYKEESFTGYRGARKLAEILKGENIDCVVILNPKKEFHLASFLARIPVRVGYDRKWGFCLNRKIKDKKYQEHKHEVYYNIDLIKLICSNTALCPITFPVDDLSKHEQIKDVVDLNGKYIVMHPFTSNPQKKVDRVFWETLTKRLKESFKNPIVLIGEEKERKQSVVFEKDWGVKNLTGQFSLRVLAAFLKRNSLVFIGLDSGPMHLASILDKPVVGLFNISNPRRWGPWSKENLVVSGINAAEFVSKIETIASFVKKVTENE